MHQGTRPRDPLTTSGLGRTIWKAWTTSSAASMSVRPLSKRDMPSLALVPSHIALLSQPIPCIPTSAFDIYIHILHKPDGQRLTT